MDRETLKNLKANPVMMAIFQASLLVASESGETCRSLAESIGIPKSTISRWINTAKNRRRNPHARTVMAPCAIRGCVHKQELGPGLIICLDCGKVSPGLAQALRKDLRPDPLPEPSKVYRPGTLKGGKS